jgi:hypothetical protein
MSVPRRWTSVTGQGGIVQQMAVAKPMATDGRFKSSAILLCVSLLVVFYNIRHILYYYGPRRHGPFGLIPSLLHYLPTLFFLNIILIMIYLAYLVASTWKFDISLMKYNAVPSWGFCFGYTPCLLIIIVFNVWGFMEENEDKQLMNQRIERGLAADAEIGIVRKPNWWSKARGDNNMGISSSNEPPTSGKDEIEMKGMSPASTGMRIDSQPEESREIAAHPGQVSGHLQPTKKSALRAVGRTPSNHSLASALTGNTLNDENVQARQQKVRSMLDV